MKVRFFADNHNARFVWSWVDGEYISEDTREIENYKGIGLRFEEVVEEKPVKKRPGRKPKVD